MAPEATSFVDHYALLGCSPSAALSELKHAYFEKLREYHPDKRRGSLGDESHRVTQDLNEAWSVLRDAEKRQSYDALLKKRQEAKQPQAGAEQAAPAEQEQAERTEQEPREPQQPSAEQRADELRREGNELYRAAISVARQHGTANFYGATLALQKYEAAIEKYSLGIELDPRSHLLQNNRALCYAALKDWQKCRVDSLRVTMLRPDFMKGWFLLVKSLWRLGSGADALRELDTALKLLPGHPDLVSLQEELQREAESCPSRFPQDDGGVSRTVSPACTPPLTPPCGSRASTPPPLLRPEPPPKRAPSLGGGRPAPEPPPEEPEDGRGATATFGGAAPRTPPPACQLPGAVPEGVGTPPPLPRKGGAAARLPAQMRQRLQSRKPSGSPMPRPDSAQSDGARSCAAAFFPHRSETFGSAQEPRAAAPQRRPSPEPNSDGTWSCSRAFPGDVTATFGSPAPGRASPEGQARPPQTRSKSTFDGNQSCGPAFFAEAAGASGPSTRSERFCLPLRPDFSHTFGSLPCTARASHRSHSLTSHRSEPPKLAVPQSDGKSLREVILFGARAFEGKDKRR